MRHGVAQRLTSAAMFLTGPVLLRRYAVEMGLTAVLLHALAQYCVHGVRFVKDCCLIS